MPSTFQSVNEAGGGGVPQFAQTQPVRGGGADALIGAASTAVNLFGQFSAARQERQETEEGALSNAALGSLQQGLLNIRMAGKTDSGVNVVDQSRLLMTKFNMEHPELRMEASKAFKAETGQAPSGLSSDEEAHQKLVQEAAAVGYDEDQLEIYIDLKQKDRINSSRITAASAATAERTLHKSIETDAIRVAIKDMSSSYFQKVDSDMTKLAENFSNGTLSAEDAALSIRQSRNQLNREIASLGEHGTAPYVKNLMQPMLDSIQLAEDITTGKIDTQVANQTVERNRAVSTALLLADPEILNMAVLSEVFKNVPGIMPQITAKVIKFGTQGLTKDGMLPKQPKPVSPLGLDDEEQEGVLGLIQNMFKGDVIGKSIENLEKSRLEAANTVTGVAEYLSRNGMDFAPEDKKFAIDILNTEGAMESLTTAQRGVVMQAMDMYVIDDVDRSIRDNIVNKRIDIKGVAGRSTPDVRNVADIANLSVQEGRIYWTLKPEFRGFSRAQAKIRELNQTIDEDITPTATVMSKGMGVSFEQFAETLIPGLGEEETTDETKKTDGVTTPVRGDDAGKATEVDTSSPETFVSSTLPTVTSIVEGSGIFPEVALAQAALESGWGKSVKGNNYYGIKGEGQTITTHEVVDGKRVKIEDEFREFEGFADSVTGYREFLTTNPRYEKALQADSPEAQAKALQEAGYATDPDYAEKLISIMKRIK